MEGFNANENTLMWSEGWEVFINETKFEKDVVEETQENSSLQIEGNMIPQSNENKASKLEILHYQRKKWRWHNRDINDDY
jgi:hypothetical protein